jgi:1,4-dihydroxy-2-naphthoyl-CoA synthase
MKQGQLALVTQRIGDEAISFGRMLKEPAAKEAFGAFMQKRKPDFTATNLAA